MKLRNLGIAAVAAMLTASMIAMPASAANITINNAVSGQTYSAYKLFKAETAGDAVTYYVEAKDGSNPLAKLEGNGVQFAKSADGTRYTVKTGKDDTGNDYFNAQTLAQYIKENEAAIKEAVGDPSATAKAESAEAVLSDVDDGYYYIDSSLGTAVAIVNDGDVDAFEKNKAPSIEKQITDGYTGGASIGDDIPFTVTFNMNSTTANKIVQLVDVMNGLDFVEGSIKVNGADLSDEIGTLETGSGFTLTFAESFIAAHNAEDVTVTYKGKINRSAIVNGAVDPITNKAKLSYSDGTNTSETPEVTPGVPTSTPTGSEENPTPTGSGENPTPTGSGENPSPTGSGENPSPTGSGENPSPTDTPDNPDNPPTVVTVYNGNITVHKVDGADESKNLAATFVILNTESKFLAKNWNTNGASDPDWVDSIDSAFTLTTDADTGLITVEGLELGTYKLRETAAPAGYNLLAQDVEFTITGTTAAELNVTSKVLNNTGATLPSTGGIGTTIFYVVGGALLVIAGVLFITKKRTEM